MNSRKCSFLSCDHLIYQIKGKFYRIQFFIVSGSLHEDLSQASYQRVEKLQYPEFRPVLILGPLAECVADKLVQDFPDKFNRAASESRRCSQAQMDRELAEGLILEYRRRG